MNNIQLELGFYLLLTEKEKELFSLDSSKRNSQKKQLLLEEIYEIRNIFKNGINRNSVKKIMTDTTCEKTYNLCLEYTISKVS